MTIEKQYLAASQNLPPAEARAAIDRKLIADLRKCAHRHGTIVTEYKAIILAHEAAERAIAERPERQPARGNIFGLPKPARRMFGPPPVRRFNLTIP